jgi:hypothetical protein
MAKNKPIRLSNHAKDQCILRGADEAEVRQAVERGSSEPAKSGRIMYRLNFQYNAMWQGRFYAIKQVAPVVADEPDEIVVVTVYTFYF